MTLFRWSQSPPCTPASDLADRTLHISTSHWRWLKHTAGKTCLKKRSTKK